MHHEAPDDWLSDALGPGKPRRLTSLESSAIIQQFDTVYQRYPLSEIPDPDRYMSKGRSLVWPLDSSGANPDPSCNEIEVAKRLVEQRPGWAAHFYTTFQGLIPSAWSNWVKPLAQMPEWLQSLDYEFRDQEGGPSPSKRRPGFPDVVGWNPEAPDPLASAVFVECKAAERVTVDQERWFATAIRLGKVPEKRLGLAQGIYRT